MNNNFKKKLHASWVTMYELAIRITKLLTTNYFLKLFQATFFSFYQ